MKHFSDDVFSASNPAFCALVLHYFLKGFNESNKNGVDFPILFLPIPLLLSTDVMSTLVHTNKATGFLNWITSNPLVKIDLHERIHNTIQITKDAILFGTQQGVLLVSDTAQFYPTGTIKEKDVKEIGLHSYTSVSERFGYWSGKLDSTKTLLYSLGITL